MRGEEDVTDGTDGTDGWNGEASRILVGDVLDGLAKIPAGSVHCCVTSPPCWGLRDYGVDGQIGLEKTPEEFVGRMVEVFRAVRRVLREDGTLWLNLGDCYATGAGKVGMCPGGGKQGEQWQGATTSPNRMPIEGLKPKDLCMMPWRVALALQADGWWLRSVICWAKKSPMPESVTDRPTSSWEPIFLMAKSERYFYDAEAVRENIGAAPDVRERASTFSKAGESGSHHTGAEVISTIGRNQRNVWHLGPEPYAEAHFATFPTEIPRRAIKAGTSEKGCCAACGAPWVRRMEKQKHYGDYKARGAKPEHVKSHENAPTGEDFYREYVPPKCVGWQPGCTCGAEVVPCLVLDPFLGSGTTVAVARELGRYGVGCELNPEYAALARERIGKTERPSTFRSERSGDAPLFALPNA